MAVMGIRKMRSCNLLNTAVFDAACLYCKLSHRYDIGWHVAPQLKPHTLWSTVMSQPLSPSSEHLSSPLDVHDDNLQQRSAISDTARQERLAALERRRNRSTTDPHDDTAAEQDPQPQPFDVNHAKRTEFRRLVDPGIMRPNSKEVALRSLRVNLLKPFVPASGLKKNTTFSFLFFSFFLCFSFASRRVTPTGPVDTIYNRRESASRA